MDLNEIENQRNAMRIELSSSKFDLDKIVDVIYYTSIAFYNMLPKSTESLLQRESPYCDLCELFHTMQPSYVAPAYHYNAYIDAIIHDVFWDDMKFDIPEELWISNVQRRVSFQIEAQALLLSLKMALDRMVSIFSYYYRGFSSETTFGRIRKSGKAEGFMSAVGNLSDTDELMAYVKDQYLAWIKQAVSPRDIITHYNDLGLTFHWDSESCTEIPLHIEEKTLRKVDPVGHQPKFHFASLKRLTTNWYSFFDEVVAELKTKTPIRKATPL
jgi:hypothetical protein